MFQCCSTSRDCCGDSPKEKKKKPRLDTTLKCAHTPCHNTIATNRITEWKAAVTGSRMFRFCCDDCWNHWLQETKHTDASKSPILFFSIKSPVTPAIAPRSMFDDIPLINI